MGEFWGLRGSLREVLGLGQRDVGRNFELNLVIRRTLALNNVFRKVSANENKNKTSVGAGVVPLCCR